MVDPSFSSSSPALVVLSGGQDSTTCLHWALRRLTGVHALSFDYSQRHSLEISSARHVAAQFGVLSHEVVRLGPVLAGTSPLVDPSRAVEQYASASALPGGIERTFVPARNILFLTLAANRAACLHTPHIVLGVGQEDYGGYPDCREDFLRSMSDALTDGVWGREYRGTGKAFVLHAPLLHLTKKETVELAVSLGEDAMEALAHTHTCYKGDYPPCGRCHACLLRARGFKEAGYPDPLIVQAKRLKLLPPTHPDWGITEEQPDA